MAPWQIAADLFALIMFLWLSHPPELRSWRWGKMLVSVPVVFCLVSFLGWKPLTLEKGFAVILGALSLGLIWRANGAYFLANGLSGLVYGGAEHTVGIRPDFRYARNALRDGELEEARRLAEIELTKDSDNFEGLMLLAEIHAEAGQPRRALARLDYILGNPLATDDQKQCAREKREAIAPMAVRAASKPRAGFRLK